MNSEILINFAPREVRAVLLEGGVLQEVFIERVSRRGLVGNVYKGRVMRVLPGMQAAFVDAGLARTGFLHVEDIISPELQFDAQLFAKAGGFGSPPSLGHTSLTEPGLIKRSEDIRRLVSQGDDLIVQVVKDPLGTKGARLTTFISLPSRYLVFMPRSHGLGISARIENEEERSRLREIMQALVSEGHPGGYIVRTAAEGVGVERLAADLAYLEKLWIQVRERSLRASFGELIHEDLSLSLRMLRDELGRNVNRVLVDSAAEQGRLQQFVRDFIPDNAPRIELHTVTLSIFDMHGVDEEINRALERKVSLKSGGYLVIDQTESMTTIDINTGSFIGNRNLEDTVFSINLEAAVAIARQLKIRNLGGIIIIDFINMIDIAHWDEVISVLKKALEADHAQTQVAPASIFGLVEMTRKRTRESLENLLYEPCGACQGQGSVRSLETICQDIFREILRQVRQFHSRELLVLAHPDVVKRLLSEESHVLAELEAEVECPIRVQSELIYEIDHYDVVLI